MFTTLIVQPLFNLLVLIYNLIPGHNFGLAIIIFTIVIRLLLWPLVKRQLHQTKLMRQLQPDIKRIRQQTTKNGTRDRTKESQMIMELYKERGVSIFASFKVMLIQLPILLGLYVGLQRILKNPHEIVNFAYPFLQHFSWMKQLASNIHLFDTTLFHLVDLTRPALTNAGVYWPGMLLVIGSAVIQYYQSKQLLPTTKDSMSLRQILRSAGEGKQADQTDVNEAVGRSTRFLLPVFIFVFTVHLASALSLYWLVSGIVAYVQQSRVLNGDVDEMEAMSDKSDKASKVTASSKLAQAKKADKKSFSKKSPASTVSRVTIEGEVVTDKTGPAKQSKPQTKSSKSKKRRK